MVADVFFGPNYRANSARLIGNQIIRRALAIADEADSCPRRLGLPAERHDIRQLNLDDEPLGIGLPDIFRDQVIPLAIKPEVQSMTALGHRTPIRSLNDRSDFRRPDETAI